MKNKILKNMDWGILICTLVLLAIGLVVSNAEHGLWRTEKTNNLDCDKSSNNDCDNIYRL